MQFKKSIPILLIIFSLWSCVEIVDPQPFSWEVSFDFPITTETILIDDALEDSSITTDRIFVEGTAYDSGYIFHQTENIDRVEVGDQFSIDDMDPQNFIQNVDDVSVDGSEQHYASGFDTVGVDPVSENVNSELGTITLDNTAPVETAPISFSSLIDSNIFSGIPTVTVPQLAPIPVIYRNIGFSEFKNATFTNGSLDINIINDMVINLGNPITITLLEKTVDSLVITGTDGDPAVALWSGIIPANGGTEMASINLAKKTLPDSIIIKIAGFICGDGEANVPNNAATWASSFKVVVEAKDLEVSSATAKVPGQTINKDGEILLAASDNKLEWAKIMNGSLAVSISNNLPIDADLVLKIPSIDKDDSAILDTFTATINLNADQNSNDVFPLNDHLLRMDLNNQKVVYSYEIKTHATDPDQVTIESVDGVTVDIGLYGSTPGDKITFSEFKGQISQEAILESGDIDVTSDSKITSAAISNGTIQISITNNVNQTDVGVPRLILDIPEFYDTGNNAIHEEIDLLPGANLIQLNLANYELRPNTVDLGGGDYTQNITYSTSVAIPSDETATYNLLDSIMVDINVSPLSFTSVTGIFSQDAMVDSNSIELETDIKLDYAVIESGQLSIEVVNNIGLIADVDFTIDEILTGLTPLTEQIHLTADPAPVTTLIDLAGAVIDLEIIDPDSAQSLNYVSAISLPDDQEMTLTFGQDISVTVQMQNLSFSEVNGYVDSIIVDIDTLEQEISALPEEMKGLEFYKVDMILDLQTEISIPLYLDLYVKAYNDDGDSAIVHIDEPLIPGVPVVIDGAEDLINIFPNKIISYGRAIADGSGTIKSTDAVEGSMEISVPLVFSISEPVELDVPVTELDPVDIAFDFGEVRSAKLFAQISSMFDFSVDVIVLGAKDSLFFDGSAVGTVDTIAKLWIPENDTTTQILDLNERIFEIIQDSLYLKNVVTLNSDAEQSMVLSGDSLVVKLFGTVTALVDPDKETEGGEE